MRIIYWYNYLCYTCLKDQGDDIVRKYNYGSIILILIVNSILVGFVQNIFDGNLSVLGGIVTFITDYIICRGLLYYREGSFSEYFRGIKTMTGKVFLMNFLVGAITVALLTLSMLLSGAGFLLTNNYEVSNPKVFTSLVILSSLVTVFLSLIFAYLNFYMADERYRDLSFFDSLKLIVKAGTKLFQETFMAALDVFKISLICGVVTFISLIFILQGMEALTILAIFFGVISAIGFFLCQPTYSARISDIYVERSEEIYREVIEEEK